MGVSKLAGPVALVVILVAVLILLLIYAPKGLAGIRGLVPGGGKA